MFLDTLKKLLEVASDADIDKFAGYIRETTELIGKIAILALEVKIKKEELNKTRGTAPQLREAYKNMQKQRKRDLKRIDDAKANAKSKSGSITEKLKRANEILAKYDLQEIEIKEKAPTQTAAKIQKELVENAEKELIQEVDLSKTAEKAELAIDQAKRKGVDTVFLGENVDATARNIMVVKDRTTHGKNEPQVIVRRQPTVSLPEWLSYEPCLAQVNIANKKTGAITKENLLAYYSKDLNCFFVSSTEYERAMNIGAILATTKEQYNLIFSKDGDKIYMTDKSMRDHRPSAGKKATWTLRECGYFVGSKNALSKKTVSEIKQKASEAGEKIPKEISELMLTKRKLTDSERQAILKYAIKNRGLSPSQVMIFLEKTKKRQEASLKSRGIGTDNIKSYEKDIGFIKETYAKDLQAERVAKYIERQTGQSLDKLEKQKAALEEKLEYTRSIDYRDSVVFDKAYHIDEKALEKQLHDIDSKISQLKGEYIKQDTDVDREETIERGDDLER